VRELGHFPVVSEMMLKARHAPGFPSTTTLLNRFGGKESLVAKLRNFCEARSETDLLVLMSSMPLTEIRKPDLESAVQIDFGNVNLLKAGRYYNLPFSFPKSPRSSIQSRPTTPQESRSTGGTKTTAPGVTAPQALARGCVLVLA
jgi:hypothetical protein